MRKYPHAIISFEPEDALPRADRLAFAALAALVFTLALAVGWVVLNGA